MTKASKIFDKYKAAEWKDTSYREFLCLWTITFILVGFFFKGIDKISFASGITCALISHGLWCYDYFLAEQIDTNNISVSE